MQIDKKIVLTVGRKTLELTVDEARELRNELNRVCGDLHSPWRIGYTPIWYTPNTGTVSTPTYTEPPLTTAAIRYTSGVTRSNGTTFEQ